MQLDQHEDVHIITQDGQTVYWPKDDINRYAPSAVCQVTHRIKTLRKILNDHTDIPAELRRKLERIAEPIPYEKEFDSSCSITVHNAIKQLGGVYGGDDTSGFAY